MKEFLLLFLFAAFNMAQAQDAGLAPNPSLSLSVDYAAFRGTLASRLEIYYSISSAELALVPAESLLGLPAAAPGTKSKNFGLVLANLDLFDANGRPVDSLSKTTAFRVSRTDNSNELSEVLVLDLSPGNYLARLEVLDLKTGRIGRDTLKITVPDLAESGLKTSSLQLARLILNNSKTEGLSWYKKGRQQIIPNPGRAYSLDDPRLYFYFEVYGLIPPSRELKSFEIEYGILGKTGDTLKSTSYHKYPKDERPLVAGSVDIALLPSGEYTLFVDVRDPASGQTARAAKPFSLFPPSSAPPVAEEELEYFPQVTFFFLSQEEREIYRTSNRTGRLNFIAEFWNKHDPTPGTPENEYQREVYGRYWKAIDRFSQSRTSKDGWQTARGRVLMLYGEPSNVEQSPASLSMLPWEKWEYNRIAGGRQAYFIFVDLRGLGKYELAHSTAPGEKQNPEWETLVVREDLHR